MDKDLIHLAPAPKGVNQRAEETDLPEGSLREAVNVVLDQAGKAKRRKGYTKVLDLSDAHSLWSDNLRLIYAAQGSLWSVEPDSLSTTPIREGVGNEPLSYAVVNEWLFYSSERVHGKLNLYTLEHRDYWGVPQPDGATLSVGAGSLPAGQYQVAVTLVSATGEESGVDAPVVVALTEPGSIVVSNIRIPDGAAKAYIYCSTVNDTRLYRQTSVLAGGTVVITQLKRGRECTTLFLEPLPPGHIVRHYKGRVLVASGNVVYYSNALHYGLYEPDNGYLPPFPSEVTMIEPVEDGFYVGADRVYFIRGLTPDEFSMSIASDHAPVRGTSMQVDAKHIIPEYVGYVTYWMDNEGPKVGVNGGMIQALSISVLTGTVATSGASGILRGEGVDRIVTTLASAQPRTSFAASDSATIEVIRSTSI